MLLTFADTHNVVAYLNKSNASEGFNQGIDFLNGSYIKYALTVSPTIYVSCIKQFWSTVVINQSNDVTRIQALVDKKKVLITEAVIRDALRLDDAEGVDCLPNKEIFTELARMGYEKPLTKLTSTMASAVICLSIGRKFDFSKYIFESLVRNVDRSLKFYMYPRFIQLIIQNQLGDLSTRTTKYISPGLTQKVFANMRRVGKGCSGVKTPLFEGLLVAGEPKEQGDSDEEVQGNDNDAAQGADTAVTEDDGRMIAELDRDKGIALMDDKGAEKKVEDAEVADDEQLVLPVQLFGAAEPKFPAATINVALVKVVAASTRRRRRVVIKDAEEESTAKVPDETKSKDKGKGIMNTAGFRLDYFKGMSYDDIRRNFKAKFNSNIEFLLKSKEKIKEEENKALESINKTRAHKTARRRKLNEEVKDVKEIKHHLGIVPDEDDVLYTEATSLARKVPVVDYHIIQLNNKPRYKIIRADGTHHLAAKHKLMLLDTATERRLLLLSQVKTVNEKCCC
nr:hypothetical protein [Tanacetum cinerariifolium]